MFLSKLEAKLCFFVSHEVSEMLAFPLENVFSSPCSFGHLDFTGSDFHRAIAERANRSIHQLKCALREGDVTVGEDMLDPSFNTSVGNEDAENAWRELQHSHAGKCECQP